MAGELITTDKLSGTKVFGGKDGKKRIGKVRQFVFHPNEKRCVGFVVKRPDVAWMFRRKDLFVSIKGFELVDGDIVVSEAAEATDKGACKDLGIDWDSCVLWIGLPIMAEDSKQFGVVGNVTFDLKTGKVQSIETSTGAASDALLGKMEVPADMIKGFRRGIGATLAQTGKENTMQDEDEDAVLGAIMVSDEAKKLTVEGGIAEKAGKTTAVITNKVSTTVNKAKPTMSNAAKATGEVINAGAYATGRQIARSKGMFAEFKAEYEKARGPVPGKSDETRSSTTSKSMKAPSSGKVKAVKKTAHTSDAQPVKKVITAKPTTPKSDKPASSKPQKNMFVAFMEEYDKARHSDD